MLFEITVCKTDGRLAILLPKEIVSGLKISEGDTFLLAEEPDGGLRLMRRNGDATTMEIMKSVAKRYSNALAELAKGE
jgi:bifunctional DNA-binding transcriptional regulator/antitoxin component of YhaV-PrlF toxin-antitoxin module